MNIVEAVLAKLKTDDWLKYPGGDGRGIIICAGSAYSPSAYIAIRHLRRCGCNLPVEVWAFDSTELPRTWIKAVDGLNTCVRYSVLHADGYQVCRAYESKIIALMNSSFHQVMLLDADNIILQDPSSFFDSAEFYSHGQIFWPDHFFEASSYHSIQQAAFDDFGLIPQTGLEIDSGQLFVDREACWKELQLAELMNQHSPEVYRRYTWGDKDTFILAWRILRRPYFVMEKRPQPIGNSVFWQHDFAGKPAFQHQRKWLSAPHVMQGLLSKNELWTDFSLQYLNDYYKVVPWTGELSVPAFRPR